MSKDQSKSHLNNKVVLLTENNAKKVREFFENNNVSIEGYSLNCDGWYYGIKNGNFSLFRKFELHSLEIITIDDNIKPQWYW